MFKLSSLVLSVLLVPVVLFGQDIPEATAPTSLASPVFLNRDQATLPVIAAASSPWQRLASMDNAQRQNASLELALPQDAPASAVEAAKKIEDAWNSGSYDAAVNLYANLARSADMSHTETILQWHTQAPATLEKVLAANVELGVRDSVTAVDIVCDSSNQQLFAIVGFQGDGYGGSYDLLKSTNNGTTWSVVFTNYSFLQPSDKISIAYVHGRLHVFYSLNGGTEIRWRRHDNTGAALMFGTSGYYKYLVGPGAANTVVDMEAFSNNLYGNNRLYFVTIRSNHKAHLYWAYADSASMALQDSISGAAKGISAVWSAPLGHIPMFFSYVDTAGNVQIDSLNYSGSGWGHKFTIPSNAGEATSLGYYRDTVVCTFSVGDLSEYAVSYNGGSTWAVSASIDNSSIRQEYPRVCMEKGQGMAIIYRFYTSTREGRYVTREYKGPGNWSTPAKFTDYEPYPVPAAITALGNGQWGVIYVTWNSTPTPQQAYFAVISGPVTDVQSAAEPLPTSFALEQNYPNPFNPSTTIRYSIATKANVTISVYNTLGQRVALLEHGEKEAGMYETRFDAAGLASGVYFCTLSAQQGSAKAFTETRKMLLIR